MNMLYHPDVISKIYAAFTTKAQECGEELDYNYQVLESLAAHRISHLYTKKDSTELIDTIPMQVAGTLSQYCKDITALNVSTFQPENIENEDIRNDILSLYKQGTFVPILLVFDHKDLEDTNDLMVIIFGIGEAPDDNFAVMTINIPEYLKVADLSDPDGAQVMYPMIYDVPRNIIGSLQQEPAMHIRLFTRSELEEKIAQRKKLLEEETIFTDK